MTDEPTRRDEDEQPPEGAPLIEFNNNPFVPPDVPTALDPSMLTQHLFSDVRGILNDLFTMVGVAGGTEDATAQLELLQGIQDGLIHTLIDVHSLIHLGIEAKRNADD